MNSELVDHLDRERFRNEWEKNFAVSANAGSGKTTAISARLAAMARSPEAASLLAKTAVVTFTNKAASQIGQKARAVLLRELTEAGTSDLGALDHLERAFFGTIHSFCLLLAQRYGQNLGIHLNPTVIAEEDDAWWEEFIEQDGMEFAALEPVQVGAFLRHVPVEDVFSLARSLDVDTARRLLRDRPRGLPPAPGKAGLEEILALPLKGNGRRNIELSQAAAREWFARFADEKTFLPPFEPAGSSSALVEASRRWMKPLKDWLGNAAAVLAAELALRYRAFRLDRGIQTYADQIEAAMAVLRDVGTLERIRGEGWRIILDEAQDTDAQQFAVLSEITRPPGAALGTWPVGGGAPPRPGHFCLVGDGQQAIYGGRADIRNFLKHLDAFGRGEGGELLKFRVTFRAPRQVVSWLNLGLPGAFGDGRPHNLGLPPAEGVVAPVLQVGYEPLAPAPANVEGAVSLFGLSLPERRISSVEGWLVEEVRQLARFFDQYGPSSVGATRWGEVTLLAPRNEWLNVARRVLEQHGLKVALQVRRQKQRDNPAFAWLTGVLGVLADPENMYELFGVLREVFAVSDALLAVELREKGALRWELPEVHPEPLASALLALRPFILAVDDGGKPLADFVGELVLACDFWSKLAALDPSGAQEEDLSRLIAMAGEFAATGGGARAWLRQLLADRDEGRPVGKAEPDAINLLTAHSAKGLEWPVVIPLGLWRRIGKPPEQGLRLIPLGDGAVQVFLDSGSIPTDTQEARDRERLRELVRLLYVTMTRVRRHLVIPWAPDFGGRQRSGMSFAEIWGTRELLESLPRLVAPAEADCIEAVETSPVVRRAPEGMPRGGEALPPLPARVLPHQLGRHVDAVRASRHESTSVPELGFSGAAEDAIEYGLWWHETLEFVPWSAEGAVLEAHFTAALVRAEAAGFAERAAADLSRLRASAAWAVLNERRWTRLSELSVFAPAGEAQWIDGVVDLTLHDPAAAELWIVDWKTNRIRSGEGRAAFLERLSGEYRLQLGAYGACLAPFFPGHAVKLWIYATAAGDWVEIRP